MSPNQEAPDQPAAIRFPHNVLDLQWLPTPEMLLASADAPGSAVAGGPLIELALEAGRRRTRALRLTAAAPATTAYESDRSEDTHGAGTVMRRRFQVATPALAVEWTLCCYDAQNFVRSEMALRNMGAAPVRLRRVFPFATGSWWRPGSLRIGGHRANFDAYKNGWQSWSYAGALPRGKSDPRPHVPTLVTWLSPGGNHSIRPDGGRADVVSEGMGMLGRRNQREALLTGFLSADRWLGQVYMQRRTGALAAAVLLDDEELLPGATIDLPPLALFLGAQHDLPTAYAEAVAREQQARSADKVSSGWCSWYYYFTQVRESDIQENVATLRSERRALPLEVAQVDDGYQAAVGDWLTIKETFPHGMAALAGTIRANGYRPGIWVAPFTVAANSLLASEHPEWLVKDARGRPVFGGKNWDSTLFGLDTTHPDARDWLRHLFTTIVRDWGFDYLKLDFLASGAVQGRRYDQTATRASALRSGLQLIRETVGDDVYLLGCGCPLLSTVGIFDAMRIGPDSASYWRSHPYLPLSERHPLPALEGALRNTLTRAWMHPALWANDPDCLLLREEQSNLTLDEVRAFAAAIGLTGGMVIVSDRMKRLSADRRRILAQLLPPLPERALPRDYFAFSIPEIITTPIVQPWGCWLLAGLFNAEDREKTCHVTWSELGLAPGAYHAAEFWSGNYLGCSHNGVTVHLAPHGSAVLALHAQQEEPHLLSTSFHIGQGAVEIASWSYEPEYKRLRWTAALNRDMQGTFMIWLPPHLTPQHVHSSARSARWRRNASGELIVSADIHQQADFTLEWA